MNIRPILFRDGGAAPLPGVISFGIGALRDDKLHEPKIEFGGCHSSLVAVPRGSPASPANNVWVAGEGEATEERNYHGQHRDA